MRQAVAGVAAMSILAGCGVNAQMASAASPDAVIKAVKFDDASAVQRALQSGFNPNTTDAQGMPLLVLAAREKSDKVTEALLADSRTDVEKTDSAGENAMMLAAIVKDASIVRMLIAKGAKVDKPGWTPLHYAASTGDDTIVTMLLDAHANVDARSPNDTTPLMMAARGGYASTIQLLIKRGANPLVKNQLGMTALDFGKRYSEPDSVKLLTSIEQQYRAQHPQAAQ
ncbi:ankyrin repeat domain-containing protein [Robbsia andropogonis]|nr:ankyrin repeat domain-containing protein [Robbsia andropogonis]MCP1117509.1 ankyrin repeat domain-containing protein [Robbsia andropogonis]MCP1126975.1 ankyrin repeat domain-containing protein [Robbsia andropogonis]